MKTEGRLTILKKLRTNCFSALFGSSIFQVLKMSLSSQKPIQEWAQKEEEIAPLFALIFIVLKLYSQNLEINSQNRGETVRNFARERITVRRKVRSFL